MKLAFTSDLHQEFLRDKDASQDPNTRFDLCSLPSDVDVTVIAGDLDVTLAASLRRIAQELPDRECIYVAGNHDYYSDTRQPQTMDEILAEGRELAAELGIHLLENDTVDLSGVRFIGATLWTDMMSVGRGHQASKIAEARGRYGMNDYRNMKRWSSAHPGKRKPATPQMTIAMHEASRAYIEHTLAEPFAGPTVVVTHHAPHPDSLDPRHAGRLDWCYASNLGLIFESEDAPDIWLHGHIHQRRDYHLGPTRVIANPRGYQFGRDNDAENGFESDLVIELEGYEPRPRGM